VSLIAPRPGEHFIEIGPGRGRLTRALLAHPVNLLAVEIDPRCCAELEALQNDRLQVLRTDILTADEQLPWGQGEFRVVGNLPYNVSSPILRWTVDHADQLIDAHYMLQLEVAERASARPGGKEYGWISVLLAHVFEVAIVKRLSPGAFRPQPKVQSAFVRLRRLAEPPAPALRRCAARFASGAFAHRRKKWPKSLSLAGQDSARAVTAAQRAGVSPDLRAEALTPEDYLAVAAAMMDASAEGAQ